MRRLSGLAGRSHAGLLGVSGLAHVRVLLPYPVGTAYRVSQGNCSPPGNGHRGSERYGYDFEMALRFHPETDEPHRYTRPAAPQVTLLKLHGSTNWLRCPLCETVYINPWGSIWEQAYRTTADRFNRCHCDTRLEAQIVSPSFVRETRAPNLLQIWKSALDVLRASDEWILIGYGFPDEDIAVRALFVRPYASSPKPPRITVIQHGQEAYARYASFFDPAQLNYCAGGLELFLRAWKK